MKTITQAANAEIREGESVDFAVDTTFVLFFLAVELGRSFDYRSFDTLIMSLTLLVLAVVPYFLTNNPSQDLKSWLAGRFAIASLAMMLGWAFSQTLGVVVPEMFKYLPMTLLIVTAMLSCYIQFYGYLKLRYTK